MDELRPFEPFEEEVRKLEGAPMPLPAPPNEVQPCAPVADGASEDPAPEAPGAGETENRANGLAPLVGWAESAELDAADDIPLPAFSLGPGEKALVGGGLNVLLAANSAPNADSGLNGLIALPPNPVGWGCNCACGAEEADWIPGELAPEMESMPNEEPSPFAFALPLLPGIPVAEGERAGAGAGEAALLRPNANSDATLPMIPVGCGPRGFCCS